MKFKPVLLISLLILCWTPFLLAQESDIEIRLPQSAISPIQPLPEGMSYQEFQKIQRKITWGRWFMAMGIPGYIHFYARHNRAAWAIVAVRVTGCAIMSYGMIDQLNFTDSFSFNISEITTDKQRTKRNFYLFMGGLMLNAFGFVVDWTHGDWIIENEKNEVLYKYGKSGLHSLHLAPYWNHDELGMGVQYRF